MGEDSHVLLGHSEYSISAAMRLDPNTHALVMATAFVTSICFAVAAMSVIGLTIHLFVPGAARFGEASVSTTRTALPCSARVDRTLAGSAEAQSLKLNGG